MSTAHNQPLSGNDMPRFGGPATMMRLPLHTDANGLDAAFVGVPLDIGTSNRSGARHGPRQIRAESCLLRPCNLATGVQPFDHLQVADLGDVATHPYDLIDSLRRIEAAFRAIAAHPCVPLTLGGDHTLTLGVLRALHARHGPLGLIHVDAHADTNDTMFGSKIAHGTMFRRALEDGLVAPQRMWQIGLRGSGYSAEDFDWARRQGVRVVTAEQCWYRSLAPLMVEARAALGNGPVYLSFDIDALDPAFAPGTGTPEIGGLSTSQALEIIRGCAGLQLVGGDVVEVSPPYDPSGNTALTAANLLFEMLCVLPGAKGGA